ncbi:ArnT family glycosyltransferase [Microbacterium sp. RG1]|uniref:ArnT family glycosyltransferase n=1 Tax=Microbacterium sp. RG1 TaxID=2489212 RepID=UPI001EE3251F|nr:glycosyltransferase family 39 protein [Microbacterium sp. RG1]
MTAVSAPPARLRLTRAAWPVGLVLIVIAAAVLTGWQVSASMSDYYGAVAMSMSKSWSNLFFGAFDPAGTVSLDKIPGSFWIPALAVRLFGFSPAAVILPNAIAATAAAVVAAFTARRLVGTTGGLLAGAVVATTPILVAVARSNQPQAFFVLALALVAWAAVRAIQQRSLGWYLLAGALIGVAFQTYMLEAWAVWPALAAAYLCTRQRWWRRIWHTLLTGAVSLVVSLAWVAVVWLVPASDRPYVGGTNSNNPWEMVFGYNGLGRFSATADSDAYRSFTPAFSGDPGPLRLFNTELAGQIAWLLPATVAAIVVLFILRWRPATGVFLGGGSRPRWRCSPSSRGCTSSTHPRSRSPSPSSWRRPSPSRVHGACSGRSSCSSPSRRSRRFSSRRCTPNRARSSPGCRSRSPRSRFCFWFVNAGCWRCAG